MPEELNFEDELNKTLDAEPFVPFTIVTASGDRYDVPSKRWVAFANAVVIVLRPRLGSVTIRLYNIVAIEVHEPA